MAQRYHQRRALEEWKKTAAVRDERAAMVHAMLFRLYIQRCHEESDIVLDCIACPARIECWQENAGLIIQ